MRSVEPEASTRRPIRIGISSCLLGETVRFDGGHKRDAFLGDTFGRFVECVAVCPEVECGLSGSVLKKDSPTCGLERVKVYDRHGVPAKSGRGLFAAALVERLPHLSAGP